MQAIKQICQRFLSLFAKRSVVKSFIIDESKVINENFCDKSSCDCDCDCDCVPPPPPITDILPFPQVEMPKVPEFPAPQPLDDTAMDTDTQHSDEDESEDTQDEYLDDHEE